MLAIAIVAMRAAKAPRLTRLLSSSCRRFAPPVKPKHVGAVDGQGRKAQRCGHKQHPRRPRIKGDDERYGTCHHRKRCCSGPPDETLLRLPVFRRQHEHRQQAVAHAHRRERHPAAKSENGVQRDAVDQKRHARTALRQSGQGQGEACAKRDRAGQRSQAGDDKTCWQGQRPRPPQRHREDAD